MSSKLTAQAVVPKRRFPEFQNNEAWEEKPLGKIAKVLQGYGFPIKYQGITKGKYPFYKVSDISNTLLKGSYFINNAINYIDDDILEKLQAKIIPPKTTIFAKIGEAIKSNRRAFTTLPCVIDNNVAGLNKIKGKSIEKFIFYYFSKVNLVEYSGGAIPSINKSIIEKIPIFVPKLKEQQKIADCLSSLDDSITAQNQKITALKQHKKGLMQQLFPAEGKTTPKRRFPEFQNNGEWEEVEAGKILSVIQKDKEKKPNVIELLTVRLYCKGIYKSGKFPKSTKKGRPYYKRYYGELLIGKQNFHNGGFGIVGKNENGLIASNAIASFKTNQVIEFVFYYFARTNFYKLLNDYIGGTGQKEISESNILKLRIYLPKNKKEQQKIADCLSSLDDLITAQNQKITALKQHKKGLMQQLFPVNNAVV